MCLYVCVSSFVCYMVESLSIIYETIKWFKKGNNFLIVHYSQLNEGRYLLFFWRKYLSKQECKLKNNLKLIIHKNSPLFYLSDVSCNYAFIIINCLLKENAFELVPHNLKDMLSLTQFLTLAALGCLQTGCPGLWLAEALYHLPVKPIPTSFTFPRTSGWGPPK